ncbi:Palmitoyltransferase SWF1 [Hyphodiscus hymeniophilus]|uniref:Palmitoyltransferase n=1 Tax=Hyphodiscus hymeniophilus TaxID=353542 RepID=A0A9P6VE18_9HELO|nr:Palmitoyltransferase SWF1 [Hyphodiscus hymeniophilus]
MGTVRNVAIAVLVISFLTFVAFFGRLPALRSLASVDMASYPGGFRRIDQKLTDGRLSAWIGRLASTLWNDRHPLVMIFFFLLLFVSEYMFLPSAWSFLTTSRKIISGILVILPYTFLWISAASDPGYITPANHSHKMTLYPYDFTVFYPGQACHTCHLLKPARSKHCSICKHCISKMDHHCIFINNCVGRGNQHWFLLLLLTTAIVTTWGTYIGLSVLSDIVRTEIPAWNALGRGFTWAQYFHIWAWTLQEKTRLGAATLLAFLTSPLVWGLLGYHIYLIWAGTTTNESMKWSDWQAEMSDGYVFRRSLPENRQKDTNIESPWTSWPVESQQIILRTEDGMPPRGPEAIGTGDWQRVWKLRDVENLYDLGFWDNLKDVFGLRYGVRPEQRAQHRLSADNGNTHTASRDSSGER